MTWFKVDDNLAHHRKVVAAGNAAMGLWVRAGAWCAQHLTDGFVPRNVARLLGTPSQARSLVKAGLWVEVTDGYQFHEWSAPGRQPTRAEVEERREAKRRAGQAGGLASGESRRGSKNEAGASPSVEPPSSPVQMSVVDVVRRLSVVDARAQDDDVINQWRRQYPSVDLDAEARAWLSRGTGHLKRPFSAWLSWLAKAAERNQPTPQPPPLHALCDHGRDRRTCPHCRAEAAS